MINNKGQITGYEFTGANVDDRVPVDDVTKHLKGLLFGDKGYIKQELSEKLLHRGFKLVTAAKKNMKEKMLYFREKVLLRKRGIIERIFNLFKNGNWNILDIVL